MIFSPMHQHDDAILRRSHRLVSPGVHAASLFCAAVFVLPCMAASAAPVPAAPTSAAGKDARSDEKKLPPSATPKEIEMGRKAAAELEKSPKIKLLDGSKDPVAKALLDKLNTMARELGKASARPLIEYKVKVVEDDSLNAFTLPNGQIYVSRGLLDAVSSDDEVAAVLSHEIGHNAHMHALRGQAKTKPLQWVSLAALAAMLTGGKAGADIAQLTPYVLTGIVNSYSVEYEKEADQAAVDQMKTTRYNPSALVTFMQRLTEAERRRPSIELGIFQTHPLSPQRVAAARKAITQAGLEFNPRDVEGTRRATVESKDSGVAQVKFGGVTLLEFVPQASAPQGGASQTGASQPGVAVSAPAPKARAEAVAARINELLRANLKWHEIAARGDANAALLVARGVEIVRITPADARPLNTTPLALAQKWKVNFGRLFWGETINGGL